MSSLSPVALNAIASASNPRRSPPVSLLTSVAPARPVSTSPSPRSSTGPSASNGQPSPHGNSPSQQSQSPFRYVKSFQPQTVLNGRHAQHSAGATSQQYVLEKQKNRGGALRAEGRTCEAPEGNGLEMADGLQRAAGDSDSKRGRLDVALSIAGPSRCSAPGQSSMGRQVPAWTHTAAPSLSHTHHLSHPRPCPRMTAPVRRFLLRERLRPWIPFLLYAFTSLSFVVAMALWKTEVFTGALMSSCKHIYYQILIRDASFFHLG